MDEKVVARLMALERNAVLVNFLLFAEGIRKTPKAGATFADEQARMMREIAEGLVGGRVDDGLEALLDLIRDRLDRLDSGALATWRRSALRMRLKRRALTHARRGPFRPGQ